MAEKRNISVRLPDELYNKLQQVCESTGVSVTDITIAALGSYLGFDVGSVGDRLSVLERELGHIKAKLRLLGS